MELSSHRQTETVQGDFFHVLCFPFASMVNES
jgi:hypothetical protein